MLHERRSRFVLLTLGLALAAALAAGCENDRIDEKSLTGAAEALPATVEFGVTQVGTQAEETVQVYAYVVDTVVVQAIELEGNDAGTFAWVNSDSGGLPFALEPNEPLTIVVRFTPDAPGLREARLRVKFAEGGDGYHVLGSGCADDPSWDDVGTPLQPQDVIIPLSGLGGAASDAPCCVDEDGDLYYVQAPGCRLCPGPGGTPVAPEPPRCDTDARVNPGVPNDPCDGIDNDCDGQTDEDFTPTSATCGEGGCERSAESSCTNGQVVPANCVPGNPTAETDERCDGLDEDCDGETDEEYAPQSFSCGIGVCQRTVTSTCEDGVVEIPDCIPGDPESADDDTCDNRDEDCDGATDEEFEGDETTCGTGACERTGSLVCVDGEVAGSECVPGEPLGETDATCDGVDDDCDGQTDEDFVSETTTCGTGVCERTVATACVDGAVVSPQCVPGDPESEVDDTCDGRDEDCDGATDEEFVPETTTCGTGVCASSVQSSCVDGVLVTPECLPDEPEGQIDDSCDNRDSDCDGETDEEFEGEQTTCGTGVCERTGSTSCVDGEVIVDDCVPGEPEAEVDTTCDNRDEDCDGETDEEFVGDSFTCGTGVCEAEGGIVCVDGQVVETECVPGEPEAEVDTTCDNRDEDCDGETDEEYEPAETTCGTGVCERTGSTACVDGQEEVIDCVPGEPESDVDDTCDNRDEDCDGETDEEFVGGEFTCGVGVCERTGTRECVGGEIISDCVPGEPEPIDTPCTDVDEDCDGATDEDLPIAGGEDGCSADVPVLWDGTAEPVVSEDCFGFTDSGVVTAPVLVEPGELPAQVGPGIEFRADGAMWVRTLPIGVQLWYELAFDYPQPELTVATQMTVQLEDYLGDEMAPGAAILLSNGNHVAWVNVVRHGVHVFVGTGPDQVSLGYIDAVTQSTPHTIRLALVDDMHVRVVIDGTDDVTFVDALVGATADPTGQARVRFGDFSDLAGSVIAWDELALFSLPDGQLDADADGVTVCGGDCDDEDGARSPEFADDPCTTVDEDCDPTTGLTPDGEPGTIGGAVVDGCDDRIPSLWDGETLPVATGACGEFSGETFGDAPALAIEAGALRIDSAGDPTLTGFWSADWPDATAPAGAWLVARARVHVISYDGATDEPGNALFLADGANRVWLNIAADRVALLGGAGALIAEAAMDNTLAFHEFWLAVAPNGDVWVTVDGRGVLAVPAGMAQGEAAATLTAGFGDASGAAGAAAHWDDFGFFALTAEARIDLDLDGVPGCDDCDDTDPTVFPGQGEIPGDAIDQNCDGDPDDEPYCRGLACVGPIPDPDPIPGSGGCYRVFEYPDGWNGAEEVLNMGVSGGTVGDLDGDGIEDIGFNHDDEAYIRFGQPSAFGLGTVPDDPLAVEPTGVSITFGSQGQPVTALGVAGVTGGDLNGDGLSDLILGTRFAQDSQAERVGRVYVFFGREDWNPLYDATLEANIVIEKGALDGWTASSVNAIADINGDGLAEIGIKAKDNFTVRARFYIFFGRPEWSTATQITLTNDDADVRYIDPTATYFVTGVGDAVHIASVGDFDGDGFGDMALGTPGRTGGRGAVFLVFGGNEPGYWPTDAVDLTLEPNVVRFDRTGLEGTPVTGAHLAQGGDLNADGFADLVFTGRHYMYVVTGRPRAELLTQLAVDTLGDPTLFYDPAVQGDYLFYDPENTYPFDVAYAGDVDGDGYSDVLVSTGEKGGPQGDLDNVSYLLYGAPVLDWPLQADIRDVYDACFHHGQSLASTHVGRGGDFNADGLDDLVFSAPLRQEVRVLYGDWY